jgi:hypothetical protein
MKTKTKNTRLVQSTITPALYRLLTTAAHGEGLSVSCFVRRMLATTLQQTTLDFAEPVAKEGTR